MQHRVRFVGGPWDGRTEILSGLPVRLMVPVSIGPVRIWRRDRTVPGRPVTYYLHWSPRRRTPYYSPERF